MRGGLSSKERNQDRAAGSEEPENGLELCAQEQCCAQNRNVLQPFVSWCSLLPTLSFLLSF